MAESRQRRRIRAAAESVTLDRSHTPNTFPGNEVMGLSADEVLADIDWSCRPSEPCGCDNGREGRVVPRHPLIPIKGDPQRPLHEPSCGWYIAYRLPWWRDPEATP